VRAFVCAVGAQLLASGNNHKKHRLVLPCYLCYNTLLLENTMKTFLTKIVTGIVGVLTLAVIAAWVGFVAGVTWGLATRGYDYAHYWLGVLI
jgi:hypothetical protein